MIILRVLESKIIIFKFGLRMSCIMSVYEKVSAQKYAKCRRHISDFVEFSIQNKFHLSIGCKFGLLKSKSWLFFSFVHAVQLFDLNLKEKNLSNAIKNSVKRSHVKYFILYFR